MPKTGKVHAKLTGTHEGHAENIILAGGCRIYDLRVRDVKLRDHEREFATMHERLADRVWVSVLEYNSLLGSAGCSTQCAVECSQSSNQS